MALITTRQHTFPHMHITVLPSSLHPSLTPAVPQMKTGTHLMWWRTGQICLRAGKNHTFSCWHLSTNSLYVYVHISASVHSQTCKEKEGHRFIFMVSFSKATFVRLACFPLCQPGRCLGYEMRGKTFIYTCRGTHQSLNWLSHTGAHT